MRKKRVYAGFFIFLFFIYLTYFIKISSQSSQIDLIAKASEARWRNDRGLLNLPFPGSPNDSRGFVRFIRAQLENGAFISNALQTHPRWAPGGSIEGQYQISLPENAKFTAEVGFIQGATGTDGVIFEVIWRERGKEDIILAKLEKKYTGELSFLNIDLGSLGGRSGLFVLKVEAGTSSAQDWAVWKSALIQITAPQRPTALPGAKEKAPIITPPAKPVKPVAPALMIPVKEIKETISKVYRYRLSGSAIPSNFLWELTVDESSKSFYFKITLPNAEFKGVEAYQIGSKACGRRLDSNIWFNIQANSEFTPILSNLTTMFENAEVISIQTEGQEIKYHFRQKNDPMARNPEQLFESIARKSPVELASKIADFSADLKVNSYLFLSSKDKKIKKILQEIENRRMKAISVIEVEEILGKVPTPPAEALLSKSPTIPFYFLFINVRHDKALGGWDNYMHCALANESINLIRYSDKDLKYEETYKIGLSGDCNKYKTKENDPKPEETEHPILIGAFSEDQSRRPDFYQAWLGDEYKDFINISFPAMNHYGGGIYGVDYRLWYELWAIVGSGGSLGDINLEARVPDRPCQGDRYYSAREWGYGGNRNGDRTCSPPVGSINRLTFTEAIKQYNKFTLQGKKNAYLMMGHVIHLLQDQSEPDHAKLTPHPAGGLTQTKAAKDFFVCELCALFLTFPWCTVCFPCVDPISCLISEIMCGSILAFDIANPQDLWATYIKIYSNPCLNGIYYAYKETCERSINPYEVGFEWLPDDDRDPVNKTRRPDNLIWQPSRIESEVRKLGPIGLPNYDAFFQAMTDYSIEAVKRHGFSADYENGNSLGTTSWTCPPVPISASKPNIDLRNTNKVESYLRLIDDVSNEAIRLGAGLIEYFYEIVNPPPYVSRVVISQNSEIRCDMGWIDHVEANGVVSRTWGGKNYTLYHGVPATIKIWFGPYSADGSTEGKSRQMRSGQFYLNSEQRPLRVETERENWNLWGNFPTECINRLDPIMKSISIEAVDDAPHLSSRRPLGNRLDKNPGTVAHADYNYPYNWINYETDNQPYYLPEQIKIGVPLSYINFDDNNIMGTDTHSLDADGFQRWIIRAGSSVTAPIKLLEQESGELIKVGSAWEQCGRYYLYISPTIEQIGYGRDISYNGRFIFIPEQLFDEPMTKSHSEAGLTISADNPYSNVPIISIQVSNDPPDGLYRLPIAIKYQFKNGQELELYNTHIIIQVRSQKSALGADRAGKKAEELLQGKEIAKFIRMGFLDIRSGAPIAFDPCASGAGSPDWCFIRDPLKMASIQIIANKEAVFISPKGEMTKVNIATLGLNIRQEKGVRRIDFQASRPLAEGLYVFSFSVIMDNKKIDGFQVMAFTKK